MASVALTPGRQLSATLRLSLAQRPDVRDPRIRSIPASTCDGVQQKWQEEGREARELLSA